VGAVGGAVLSDTATGAVMAWWPGRSFLLQVLPPRLSTAWPPSGSSLSSSWTCASDGGPAPGSGTT